MQAYRQSSAMMSSINLYSKPSLNKTGNIKEQHISDINKTLTSGIFSCNTSVTNRPRGFMEDGGIRTHQNSN